MVPAFFIGAALLAASVVGLFTNLRNPAIYHETLRSPADLTLTEEQLYEVINSYDGRKPLYVENLTDAVGKGIAHYWEDAGIDKYHLRVPFHENYLLYFASFVFPGRFRKYEFANYKRAIERGVGLCSQSVIIEGAVLRRKGLQSRVILLSGEHVVLQAEVSDEQSGTWWVADPDYGVTIPFDISTIEKNPELVADSYSKAGYDEPTVSNLMRIYGKGETLVISRNGSRWYHYRKWIGERVVYVLIWVIPGVLMLPMGIRIARTRVNQRRARSSF